VIVVHRLYCPREGKTLSLLPDFCVPRRQHSAVVLGYFLLFLSLGCGLVGSLRRVRGEAPSHSVAQHLRDGFLFLVQRPENPNLPLVPASSPFGCSEGDPALSPCCLSARRRAAARLQRRGGGLPSPRGGVLSVLTVIDGAVLALYEGWLRDCRWCCSSLR